MSTVSQQKIALIACGSFSPVTYLHLRVLEMARDHLMKNNVGQVVTGILSPVSDGYKKTDLAPAPHRVEMLKLAVASSDWLEVDSWESENPEFTPTAIAFRHFSKVLEERYGEPVKLFFVCGSDLFMTFSDLKVWDPDHVVELFGHGIIVIERTGYDSLPTLKNTPLLAPFEKNVQFVQQLIANEISSTSIRKCIRAGLSIKYLTADSVIDYIRKHKLWAN
eukprot:TRINITY_DN3693_c0_g1_i1.p1 TRINITY_DN3693_c0_g1~~TRINITY_DN3693_c0_g1_i1.p1  ORF type:complete len:221 (+),score=37.36 TRINITY_DN3693_c0_g1_i1:78-740(+)